MDADILEAKQAVEAPKPPSIARAYKARMEQEYGTEVDEDPRIANMLNATVGFCTEVLSAVGINLEPPSPSRRSARTRSPGPSCETTIRGLRQHELLALWPRVRPRRRSLSILASLEALLQP